MTPAPNPPYTPSPWALPYLHTSKRLDPTILNFREPPQLRIDAGTKCYGRYWRRGLAWLRVTTALIGYSYILIQ